MSIRVSINGAFGKMGQHTAKAISEAQDLELVGQLGRHDHLTKHIHEQKPDVVVDFTEASCAFQNTREIIEAGARPVIGTSGLSESLIQPLQALARDAACGGIIAPNFTIGAVLMMQLAAKAAPYFEHVEIIEMHHQHKKDAPSGTAIRTAEMVASAQSDIKKPFMLDKARGDDSHGPTIHSVRLPGLFTHQSVIFGGEGETLTIKHDCSDRLAAMPGVVLACQKVMDLNELVYGLEHIL